MTATPRALSAIEDLYEHAACGLLVTARDGLIQRVNHTFCDWVGHTADELVGKRKLQELLTMGGRIFHQTHWEPLLQMQGSIAEVKLDIRHRDGKTIPMMLNAVRRERDGVVRHEIAVFVAQDRHQYEHELLHARKRAEELVRQEQLAQQDLMLARARLRLALESAQLHVWDFDAASGKRRYEDGVAHLLGHATASPVTEQEYAAAIAEADRDREAAALAAARDSASGSYHCQYCLVGVDGVTRTIASSGRGFFDASGTLLQFVGVLQDVTQGVGQRAAAEDRALFAEQMVGIVSHDLRNPLSAIQMSAYLLERGELTSNQRTVLGRINNSTGRAQRLIADLLDFTLARVGAGLTITLSDMELHQLVSDSVEELAVAFPGRQIEHVRVGDGQCHADADRLIQLIGNLVGNAVAYGAPDRPVRVTSTCTDQGIEISVHNEGVPIPAQVQASLFEPMIRGAGGKGSHGVGLGLFIVREIARSHAGDVSVHSSPDAGTTFSVRIPSRQP
jgi:sigma-B regulation protein RsbU (phosphoserine phosphatase)